MSLRRSLLCLCCVAALSVSPRAQTPPSSVIIDLVALTQAGSPVTDLEAKDLELRIDGRVQPITDLQFVEPPSPAAVTLPAPYATNQIAQGRTLAVAVDVTRMSAALTPTVSDGVNALVGVLTPRDRLGLVVLAGDGFSTDFTTRHASIQDAASTVKTSAPIGASTKEREAAAVASLNLLDRLCASLAVEPGFKTVIFLSAPFTPSSASRRAIQAVGETVARQRIHLVIIDPSAAVFAPTGGLAALSAATGGVVMPAATTGASAFVAAAARTATRYEVSFEPTERQQNDRSHRVEVRTTRANVLLSTPPALVLDKPSATAEPMVPLTDMLDQTRAFRDLSLRAAVFPVMNNDRSMLRLLILGETEDATRSLAWAEFALIAPSGATVSQWKAEGAEAAMRPIMTAVLAPEGSYRLRMAASQLSGRRGAVDVEFDARLGTAGPFTTSPMMFGALSEDSFMPQLRPAANAQAIMGYVELYGTPEATQTVSARFEIARTPDSPPIVEAPGSVRTTPDPDRRAALATLDISSLTPGDYLVTAVILVNDQPVGRVTRTLRRATR